MLRDPAAELPERTMAWAYDGQDAVRRGRFTLVEDARAGMDPPAVVERALYDLEANPGEQFDVSAREAEVARALGEKLSGFRGTLSPLILCTACSESIRMVYWGEDSLLARASWRRVVGISGPHLREPGGSEVVELCTQCALDDLLRREGRQKGRERDPAVSHDRPQSRLR